MKFSKTTYNMATKYNVELCTSIDNELHIIVDPENNDCASASYEIHKNGTMSILNNWTTNTLPDVLQDEKDLRSLVKFLTK